MKKFIFTLMLSVATVISFATITIVDINGGGQFTSIQDAIDNSFSGDTIQVWPGTYTEAIIINKDILLQGSGYENTILTSVNDPTVNMSNGTLKWFTVSSTMGRGIYITNGKIKNCLIKGCATEGIYNNVSTYTPYIQNCIVVNCGGSGIYADNSSWIFVVNTISRNNTGNGFFANNSGGINRAYCNGNVGAYSWGSITNGQGCIDSDPIFVSATNYHLSTGSPCFNTGQPSLSDPDGSVSDMGYFGGPDCPIFPVVYEMTISPNGNNINVQAKARANY